MTQNQSEYNYTRLYWGQNEKSRGGLDRDNPHFYFEFLSIRVLAFLPSCYQCAPNHTSHYNREFDSLGLSTPWPTSYPLPKSMGLRLSIPFLEFHYGYWIGGWLYGMCFLIWVQTGSIQVGSHLCSQQFLGPPSVMVYVVADLQASMPFCWWAISY